MPELLGRCPVCEAELTVTRLHCGLCGTGLDGSFHLTPFNRLTRDQIAFAEVFLKCRGVIREVERELEISYPTVRSRLDDLIRALGFDVTPESPAPVPPSPEGRREILDGVAAGRVSADDAARLLRGEERQQEGDA